MPMSSPSSPETETETIAILPAAQAAADWWAERLLPQTPPRFDNGDQSAAGGLTMAYALLHAVNAGHPPAEQVEGFRARLAQDIDAILQTRRSIWIDVDYGPDVFLSKCLVETDLRAYAHLLPWKTGMDVSREQVRVSLGYQGEWKTIFPAEETPSP